MMFLPTQVQGTVFAHLRWQGFTKPANLLFQVSDCECSIKRRHHSSFVHWHSQGDSHQMVHEASHRFIKKRTELEKLFLTRFFEDDTEVFMPTLLTTKQKGESIKAFVERFQSLALRWPSDMTQSTLETCCHSLLTALITQMWVAECRSWKQLISQGEQAESIIDRIKAEREQVGTRSRPSLYQ